MAYKYTIAETHTNSKSDPSPVILHDAYTDEPVRADGSDLVFPLEEGIIVRPHAVPNDTDRYLQTGVAELRLRNVTKITVRNGKTYPCVGEQFTILHHKYCPDAGVFQLELLNNLRHGELYYDFTCDSVEYSFSEFAGDSCIQRAKDYKQETIRRFLRQGRGEAVMMLRRPWLDDDARHDYFDAVLYAVTHDLRRDQQCDADRTQYHRDLIESFRGDDREVLERAMTLTAAEAVPEEEEIPPHVPHPRPDDPLQTIERIIEFTRNPEGKTVHPMRFRQFFLKKATPGDVRKLAEAAKTEPDPSAKARLYSLFGQTDYPGDPAELITLAKEHEPLLQAEYRQDNITAFMLQRALSRLRHPAVREYGFDLIERGRTEKDACRFVYGFAHWAANYDESADFERFCDFLTNLPEWLEEEPRHSIEFDIIQRMFSRRFDDVRTYGHLVWVYENTYCSCCRRKAVEILYNHGHLQNRIREQCRFDCDPYTREIAEREPMDNQEKENTP